MRFRKLVRIAASIAVAVAASAGFAGDDVQVVIDDARALARKGDPIAAAARFGDAVAMAHKSANLADEEKAANALSEFFATVNGRPTPEARTTTDAGAMPVSILAAVLAKLDPARRGAFVSAPVLARNVLLLATESGDSSGVAVAAKVAAAHGTKSGRACAAVASYAAGMKALAEKQGGAAAAPLRAAFDAAKAVGWTELAWHAGTEMVIAAILVGDVDGAVAAVRETASLFDRAKPTVASAAWQACVAHRLTEAPEPVRKALEEAGAPVDGPSTGRWRGRSGAPGESGGAGGSGASQQSDVAKLLAKLGKTKPFISVARTAQGFEVRWATAPDDPTVRPADADSEDVVDKGGVTVSLFGPSVALRMIDLVGTHGQPGGSSSIDPVRAFYLLAPGETWSVLKDGTVTITGK